MWMGFWVTSGGIDFKKVEPFENFPWGNYVCAWRLKYFWCSLGLVLLMGNLLTSDITKCSHGTQHNECFYSFSQKYHTQKSTYRIILYSLTYVEYSLAPSYLPNCQTHIGETRQHNERLMCTQSDLEIGLCAARPPKRPVWPETQKGPVWAKQLDPE